MSNGNFLEEFYLDIDTERKFAVTNINSNGDLIIKNDSNLINMYNLNTRKFIELKDNFILMPKEKSNSPSILSVFACTSNSINAYIFNKNYSDTLYFIRNNKISPSSVLTIPNIKELGGEKLMGMGSQEGINLFFPFVTNDNLFIQTLITSMNVTSSSISILKSPKSLYLYNIKSKLLSEVNKFNFNSLFEKVYKSGDKDDNNKESLSAFFGYGYNKYFGSKHLAFAIPAYKVKHIINDNLDDDSLNPSIKDKLTKLNNDLSEESNPVIVMGLLK